jgi:hypothetical protein
MADPRSYGQAPGSRKPEFYVTGSGPVWVPQDRLGEISSVIAERHTFDAERALLIGTQMRRAV